MARAKNDRGARGRKPRTKQKATTRDRAMEGGFGPWGAPRPPQRERRADESTPSAERSSRLRVKGTRTERPRDAGKRRTRATTLQQPGARRRRRRPLGDVEAEIRRLGRTRAPFLLDRVSAATEAYAHDRDSEALSLLRPVRDAIPDAPSVRELCGLAHYRLGNYRAAAKELEVFVELTDSVEQHPVLMDCYRAQRRWARVEDRWRELAEVSPSAELVTEGRIVAAGALADQGDLEDALALLRRKAGNVKRPKPHHLRLWYALADLEERAGNLANARTLFNRVHAGDPDFADVSSRRAALA